MNCPLSIVHYPLSRKGWGWAFPLLLAVILIGCESVSCPLNNTVVCRYGFYAASSGNGGLSSISVADSITVTAMGTDTTLINRQYNQSSLELPMSFYAPADTLIWTFTSPDTTLISHILGRDTIVVCKTNRHHFDDPSCPVHIFHHIDSIAYTHNLIDSIIVATPDVNYDEIENIQIIFRTE